MKIKKYLALSLLCTLGLILSACSTPGSKGTGDDDEGNINQGGNNGAQTAGLGDESQFGGEGGRKGTLSQRTYYFDFDRSDIREEDKPAILANANYLAAHSNKKVIVEGHTDPRGSREYNVALGERRANAVTEMLKNKGVSQHQVRVVSYGAQRLAASGRTEEDFQKDRRARIDYQN